MSGFTLQIFNLSNFDFQYFYLNVPQSDLYQFNQKHNNTKISLPQNLNEYYFENSCCFLNSYDMSFENCAYFESILNPSQLFD